MDDYCMTSRSPLSVLLLSESESLAALDRRTLRDAGVTRIRVLTSGSQAARILAGLSPDSQDFQPDIIVCSQKLADMDGEQFCAILRLHPRLLATPVLLILPNDSEVEQLRTLGCGASALLGRPYSVTALRDQLATLAASLARMTQLQQAARYTDTRAFDAALSTYGILLKPVRQPEDYFRVGMQCLQQHRWNNALNAFQRALRNAQIKGEAELGMAAAWKGKGDLSRFRFWLARAADTFVRAQRWHRARAAYARLLQDDPSLSQSGPAAYAPGPLRGSRRYSGPGFCGDAQGTGLREDRPDLPERRRTGAHAAGSGSQSGTCHGRAGQPPQ